MVKLSNWFFPTSEKREFQFFSDFQNFFGFLKFREKCFFWYTVYSFQGHGRCPWDTHYQFSIKTLLSNMAGVAAYSFTLWGVECQWKVLCSIPTRLYGITQKLEYKSLIFFKSFASFHYYIYDVYNIFWCKIWTFKLPRTILWKFSRTQCLFTWWSL